MAGIGFALKKLFEEEYLTSRTKAYIYSALVSAGPWIAAVVTVNALILISNHYFNDIAQRDLFMGTIVYSFVFSQILTAPWQMLITRFISDKLYSREYDYIRSSFFGLSRLIFIISFVICLFYYYSKSLPIYYKILASTLFLFISLLWILMVYLSAVKNYAIISYAFIIGGTISVVLTFVFLKYPVALGDVEIAGNILLAYTAGIVITCGILLYTFLTTFYFGNNKQYEFLKYFSRLWRLFFIGLFYTLGLWIDDILMWYSSLGVDIYETYKYAPLYDNAMFLAYLTVIPTMILFVVSVETEFYDTYKKYYGFAVKNGTFEDIELAGQEMRNSIYRQLIYALETQTTITLTTIVLSGGIFSYFGIPLIVRDIFRIASLGALCNIFVLLIILILLYFEDSEHALIISAIFVTLNGIFTYYFIPRGVEFYGAGYFIGSFITLIISIILLIKFLREINYNTFGRQPLFIPKEKGSFVLLADFINRRIFND